MKVDWPAGALPNEVEPLLQPGDYTRHPKGSFWMLRAPSGQIGTITMATHSVEEFPDGTITVRPSLDYKSCPQGQTCVECAERDAAYAMMYFGNTIRGWHGWLTRGEWVQG